MVAIVTELVRLLFVIVSVVVVAVSASAVATYVS